MSAEGGLSYIEQFSAPEKFECQERGRPMMLARNDGERWAIVFRPRCKRWSCPYCAEINARLWTATAIYGAASLIERGEQVSFLTLTSHRKLDAAGSVAVFGKAWNNLRRRASRAGSGEFLLIPERHQDGRLHAHAVETYTLGERWWKDNAAACGLGYMADEEIARTAAGVGGYASKYLTKAICTHTWPKGLRRVRTSRGFPRLPKPALDDAWRFETPPSKQPLDNLLAELRADGFMVGFATSADAWLFMDNQTPD